MSVQYNVQLNTHTAVDEFGQVLAIYDPAVHGTLADFRRLATSLKAGG